MIKIIVISFFMGITIWRCEYFETIEGTWTPGDQDIESVHLFFINNHSELCDSIAFMDSIRSYFSTSNPPGLIFSNDKYWTWWGAGEDYFSNEDYAFDYTIDNSDLTIYTTPITKIPYSLNGDELKLKERRKIKVLVSNSINNFCDVDYDVTYWQNYKK